MRRVRGWEPIAQLVALEASVFFAGLSLLVWVFVPGQIAYFILVAAWAAPTAALAITGHDVGSSSDRPAAPGRQPR